MSELGKCKSCGNQVAKNAKCPSCGKDSRSWPRRHKFLTVIGALIVLGIVMAVASGGGDSNSSGSASGGGSDDKAANTPPVKVGAAELIKSFEENEAIADKKYKDKRIQVSGTLDKVDTDIWNDEKYMLQIGGGGDFELIFVRCNGFTMDQVESLKKGDKVTAVGEFEDGGDLGVDLKDCELV